MKKWDAKFDEAVVATRILLVTSGFHPWSEEQLRRSPPERRDANEKNRDTPRCAVCPKAQDPFSFKWEPPAQRLPSDLRPGIFRDGFSSRNIFKAKSSY